MGHVVVKLKMVIDYCMLRVVELQQVLECSSSFFLTCFHIMYIDRLNVYDWSRVASQEAGHTDRVGEGREGGEHDLSSREV